MSNQEHTDFLKAAVKLEASYLCSKWQDHMDNEGLYLLKQNGGLSDENIFSFTLNFHNFLRKITSNIYNHYDVDDSICEKFSAHLLKFAIKSLVKLQEEINLFAEKEVLSASLFYYERLRPALIHFLEEKKCVCLVDAAKSLLESHQIQSPEITMPKVDVSEIEIPITETLKEETPQTKAPEKESPITETSKIEKLEAKTIETVIPEKSLEKKEWITDASFILHGLHQCANKFENPFAVAVLIAVISTPILIPALIVERIYKSCAIFFQSKKAPNKELSSEKNPQHLLK